MFKNKGVVFGLWLVAMAVFYFAFRRSAAEERNGASMGAMPAPMAARPAPASAATGPTTAGGTLHGKISIAAALKDKAKAGDTLFIIARKSEAGPPLAAKRETVSTFPIEYTLGAENVMMAGSDWSGEVVVTARVDKDGNATTKNPGDLVGKTKPITVGSQSADIVIDEAL